MDAVKDNVNLFVDTGYGHAIPFTGFLYSRGFLLLMLAIVAWTWFTPSIWG